MMPISSVLAFGIPEGLLEKMPLMTLALVCALLVVAFFVGFEKGFRWVRWGGVVWLFAGGLYFVASRVEAKYSIVSRVVARLGGGETVQALLPDFLLAMLCIGGALVVYGVCTILFRPSVKRVPKRGDLFTKTKHGDYEEEWIDYDDYEDYRDTTMLVRKGFGTPSMFSRLLGGACCVINTGMVLFVIVAFGFLFIGSEPWKSIYFSALFKNKLIERVAGYISRYGVDLLFIGIMVKIAFNGYKTGLVESLRSLFVKLGVVVAIAVALLLPFSRFADPVENGGFLVINLFVNSCVTAAQSAGLPGILATLAGKLLSSLLIGIVLLLGVWLMNYALKHLDGAIKEAAFLRRVDGSLSAFVYVLVGLVVSMLICAALYVLGAIGVFDFGALLAENSLSKTLLDVCGKVVEPILERVKGLLGKVF